MGDRMGPPAPTARSDDPTLVAAARGGDRRAFAALVERHYPVLLATCLRAAGRPEAAADAAQEAVLQAMLGLARLRDDARFGSWLVGIGLNVCRRDGRDRARLAGPAGAEPAADGRGPAELAEAAQLADGVRGAIAALPDGQRHAVALFYLAGLTHAEVADRLGVRVGAVKTRLHKARERLRRELTDTRPERPTMSEAAPLTMRIADLRRTAGAGAPPRHVVFLEDERGHHVVPIWIGPTEATALAVLLEDVELPRPSPYQLSTALLRAAGAAIDEVRINRLAEAIFYAEVRLANGAAIDARPSDALALALVAGAPILVDRAVLEEAARNEAAIAEEVARARAAPDDVRTIAGEARARLEENARELAEFVARAGERR